MSRNAELESIRESARHIARQGTMREAELATLVIELADVIETMLAMTPPAINGRPHSRGTTTPGEEV